MEKIQRSAVKRERKLRQAPVQRQTHYAYIYMYLMQVCPCVFMLNVLMAHTVIYANTEMFTLIFF